MSQCDTDSETALRQNDGLQRREVVDGEISSMLNFFGRRVEEDTQLLGHGLAAWRRTGHFTGEQQREAATRPHGERFSVLRIRGCICHCWYDELPSMLCHFILYCPIASTRLAAALVLGATYALSAQLQVIPSHEARKSA